MWPLRSTSAPVAAASCAASGDACTPAAQTTVCASMRSVPSLVCTSTPDASTLVTLAPIMQLDAEVAELAGSRRGEVVTERRQRFLAAVDEHDAHRRRIERTELAAQAPRRELADLSGDLDAGGAGADDHDREPLCFSSAVGAISAISNAPKIRRRSSSASSMVFMPGANNANSSCPKYDWPAPAATIRLS